MAYDFQNWSEDTTSPSVYSSGATSAAPVEWWQSLLGTVVNGAVKKYTTTVQPNTTYHTDANGNLVADGSTPAGSIAAAAATNPLLIMAVLAVGGFLIYKLVK